MGEGGLCSPGHGITAAAADLHPRAARVIEERVFADRSIEETASTLGVSIGTVKRDYAFGRAWLARELSV